MNLSAISLMAGPTPVTREKDQEMSVFKAGKHLQNVSKVSITTEITSMNARHQAQKVEVKLLPGAQLQLITDQISSLVAVPTLPATGNTAEYHDDDQWSTPRLARQSSRIF